MNWIISDWDGDDEDFSILASLNCPYLVTELADDELLWNCTETAPKLLRNCTETALKLPQSCSETALKLHWNCTETALKRAIARNGTHNRNIEHFCSIRFISIVFKLDAIYLKCTSIILLAIDGDRWKWSELSAGILATEILAPCSWGASSTRKKLTLLSDYSVVILFDWFLPAQPSQLFGVLDARKYSCILRKASKDIYIRNFYFF